MKTYLDLAVPVRLVATELLGPLLDDLGLVQRNDSHL